MAPDRPRRPFALSPAEAVGVPEAAIGGKARGLAWLCARGFDVPPWRVVPWDALHPYLAAAGLIDALREATDAPDAPDAHYDALADRIAALALDAADRRTLAGAVDAIAGPDGAVAVRSSAAGEDAAHASFAGQMETYLHLRDPAAVERAVFACLASAFRPQVVRYRRTHGLAPVPAGGGVIVQAMVEGDVSGVVFTAHPVTGDRSTALVTAAYGLGAGVVDDRVPSDAYEVGVDDGVVRAEIARKDAAVASAPDGGTQEIDVAAERRDLPCLTDDAARTLVALAASIADERGLPLDIEWTRRDGTFHLLQARPITALPPGGGRRVVWDNSNIQESYCGVTTPLTYSFARRAYATVYAHTMRAMGLPESVVQSHREVLDHLLGLVRGRIYYNIGNWYRGLLLLPAFRQNKADLERMMGLTDPVDFVEDRDDGWAARVREAPRLARTLARLLLRFRRLDALVASFMADFEAAYAAADRRRLHRLGLDALVRRARDLRGRLLERWSTPIVGDFFVMMMNGRVHRTLERAGLDAPERTAIDLLTGEHGLASVEPTRRLLGLAARIRARPEVRARFEETADDDLLDVVRIAAPDLHEALLDFVERFGDRGMGELKLETRTPREAPGQLFALLRNYLPHAELTGDALDARESTLRAAAEAEAFERIREHLGRRRLRRFQRDLEALRRGIRHRETMRLARTRMFGLFRSLYLAIGARLRDAGRLDDARDVFYLTVEEIDAFVDGESVQTDLAAAVAARRREFAAYEDEAPPHHFITEGAPALAGTLRYPYEAPPQDGPVLRGTGCHPGVVEGRVRVVTRPEDAAGLDGEILVAVRTDPGWAPLFPTARGLLVERGSALSHSAVVARELGLPTVVGLPGLTARVRTGDRVRLDGGAGTVHLLTAED